MGQSGKYFRHSGTTKIQIGTELLNLGITLFEAEPRLEKTSITKKCFFKKMPKKVLTFVLSELKW